MIVTKKIKQSLGAQTYQNQIKTKKKCNDTKTQTQENKNVKQNKQKLENSAGITPKILLAPHTATVPKLATIYSYSGIILTRNKLYYAF